MAVASTAKINRPRPTWSKVLNWTWLRTTRTLEVRVSYAADTPLEWCLDGTAADAGEPGTDVPNSITLSTVAGDDLRLTRAADTPLEWCLDGTAGLGRPVIHLLDEKLPGHAACCKVPLVELEALGDKAVPGKTGRVNCPRYGWAKSLLDE